MEAQQTTEIEPSAATHHPGPAPATAVVRLEEDDAVQMLLGLTGPGTAAERQLEETQNKDTEGVNPNDLPPLSLQILATEDDLTTKGRLRLDADRRSLDTRVRPPKAATKLIPDTWRHIRLPEAVSACKGEDLVVMWAFYNYPEAIPYAKAASLLNYKIETYTSGECCYMNWKSCFTLHYYIL